MNREGQTLCILGGTALTMNGTEDVIEDSVIRVKDGNITSIKSQRQAVAEPGEKALDAKGCLVLPGFINGHTHAAMTLLRGAAENLPLERWLSERIFPLEQKWGNQDFVYLGTLLSAVEMIRSGTTTFNDMYYFEDFAAKAAHEAGLRAICGETLLESPHLSQGITFATEQYDQFLEKLGKYPLVMPSIAPHAIYDVARKTWEKLIQYAADRKIRIQLHLSEVQSEVDECLRLFGKTPPQYLDELGLWSHQVTAAHATCVTAEDIALLGKRGVGIFHNPESNLKLGTRLCPVVELIEAGAHVGLGTDSAASNNNLDLFQEIDFAAKLQSFRKGPGALRAKAAVKMLTIEGARALQLDDKIGSLEEGKAADIIAVDIRNSHSVPLYDPYVHLVYSASASDVKHSIVNGRVLMQNHVLTELDEAAVLKEATLWGQKIGVTQLPGPKGSGHI